MILTFVVEFSEISRESKIPKHVKFEVVNKNISLGIIKLFKDKDIY